MKKVTKAKMVSVEVDVERLTALQKALGAKLAARVGILGRTTNRKTGPAAGLSTNAFIGLVHEMGSKSSHIPRRSFLADTFFRKGKELVAIKGNLWKWMTSEKPTAEHMREVYKALGIQGEALVQQAFETGGFGAWPALKSSTVVRKGSSSILIDTAQLRRAVTSDVVKS